MASTDIDKASRNLGDVGNAITAFAGMAIATAVDFGLPLTDQQQVDIMYLIITGIALYNVVHSARNSTTVAKAITRLPRKTGE